MAVLEVACPGCGLKLKAPDTMAGKKGKCKKCGASFRLPGGDPLAESVGDSQMLSSLDAPAVPAPEPAGDAFNFASLYDAPPEPPAPKPEPEPKAKPAAAKKAGRAAPKAAALPPVENFSVNDGVPETTPEALSLDDEPADAPPDPFAFPGGVDPELADAAPGALVRSKPNLEEAPRRGGYRARPQKSGKGPLIVGIVLLLAVGGGIGAAVVMFSKKDPEPVKKTEKKDEAKDDSKDDQDDKDKKGKDAKGATGKDAKGKDTPGRKDATTKAAATKGKDAKEPPKELAVTIGPGGAALDPGPAGPTVNLPPGQVIGFKAVGAKPEVFQAPASKIELDVAFTALRRVLPTNKVTDGGIVWQSGSGFQGKGERLTLDMYSPSGKRTDRIEFDGDGRPDPVCDLSANGEQFAHVADGKVTVWNVQSKTKLLDKFDPYAEKADHKKAGVAAVYFTADAKAFATVSTAGAVHLWDAAGKSVQGEFVPPKGTPGRVAQGKGVAITPERDSLVVAVGGTVTLVGLGGGKLDPRPLADLKGDVGRSLAIGAVAGKVVYAVETGAKKEKAVMMIDPNGTYVFLRVPASAGEPVSAGWADGQIAVVGTNAGAALWFEFDDGKFLPIALVQTAGGKALHLAGVACHWYVMPNPAVPTKCVQHELGMPPEGLIEFRELGEKRTAHTLKLDAAGLAR